MSEIKELENKIMSVEGKIKKLKSQISTKKLSRKERAAHLIQVGALLEIAGIDNVDKNILLGYFLWFKDVPETKLQKLYNRGKAEFEKRQKNKLK